MTNNTAVDHFKRGYQERAETRDKEFYSQRASDRQGSFSNNNNNGGGGGGGGGNFNNNSSNYDVNEGYNINNNNNPRFSNNNYNSGRGGGRSGSFNRGGGGRGGGGGSGGNYPRQGSLTWQDRGGDRERFAGDPRNSRTNFNKDVDRITIVCGLDIGEFLKHLERAVNEGRGGGSSDGNILFHELDLARDKYPEAFRSGKALTALISGSARRRNVRLAYGIWDWLGMQAREGNIQKNTYHYNSMITVAATARKPQNALELMKEMSREGIDKNEVT